MTAISSVATATSGAFGPTIEDMPEQSPAPPAKRCAIVGTAPTWKLAPWHDPTIDILGLNDGYALGWRIGLSELPRATHWFDLHPFGQMAFSPKGHTQVSAASVPAGAYLRPEGHLQWLRTRPFPVFVNQAPADWPAQVQTFPRQAIQDYFGTTYFCSTPAWMLAWALKEGYTAIEVYGIHLATQWEYIEQRPNFEWWLALALARGVAIKLPEKCPLMKSKHVYAYEPKPNIPLTQADTTIALIKQEGARLHQQLAQTPRYALGRQKDLRARLAMIDLELADAKQAYQRVQQMVMA